MNKPINLMSRQKMNLVGSNLVRRYLTQGSVDNEREVKRQEGDARRLEGTICTQ